MSFSNFSLCHDIMHTARECNRNYKEVIHFVVEDILSHGYLSENKLRG
jgi:predicted RNase H-like HicB family nuclease